MIVAIAMHRMALMMLARLRENGSCCIQIQYLYCEIHPQQTWTQITLNWSRRAGWAGGLCFQMKNENFRRAGGLHRRQKGGPAGCTKGLSGGLRKRTGRPAERGSPPASPFLQPSLMCSPPARFNVQPTGPSCSAACRPALLCSSPAPRKLMFFIWQHGPPARPARRPSV